MRTKMKNAREMAPHDQDAEEAVLGSLFVESDAMLEVAPVISADDFFDPKTREIFEAMKYLFERRTPIDQITVAQRLNEISKLEAAGGPAYLAHLVSVLPTSLHALSFARIVYKLSFQRSLIDIAGKIATLGYAGLGDSEQLYDSAHGILESCCPACRSEIVTSHQYADAMFSLLTDRRNTPDDCVPYGYPDLDKELGGLFPGELIVIGARPGVGKTQVELEISWNAARNGKKVLFASAEMPIRLLAERHLAMGARIGMKNLRLGNLTDDDWDNAMTLMGQVSQLPLYFLDAKRTTSEKIARVARAIKLAHGLDLVVVDYLQILGDPAQQNNNLRVAAMIQTLKELAKDEGLRVVVASQLNRAPENRGRRLPTLADLRDSGAIEQDADIVLLLHRPELEDKTKEPGILYIKIAKARQLGEAAGTKIRLAWNEKERAYRSHGVV